MNIDSISDLMRKYPKHRLVIILVGIAFLSLIIAYCSYFTINNTFPSKRACLLLAFYLFVIPASVYLVIGSVLPKKLAELGIIKRAACILLCWLPFLIAVYPGNIWYHDTCFQVCQYYGNEMPNIFASLPGYSFTDHHPILDTAIFGSFIQFGNAVFSSPNLGFFLFVLMQSVLTALVFSYGFQRCINRGVSNRIVAGLCLFVSLCPLFPFAVSSMAKDMLNAPLVLLFCFCYADIAISKTITKKQILALLAISILISLTKKTGFYLVLLALVILLFKASKVARIPIIAVMTATLFVNSIFIPNVVYKIFDVSPGSAIEAFALPIQQVSRAVIENPESITSEERNAIDALIGYDSIPSRYIPSTADGVKGIGSDPNVNYYPSSKEILDFTKAWLTVGLKSPSSYVKATLAVEAGWLTLNSQPIWFQMLDEDAFPIQPPNGAIIIQRPAVFQGTSSLVANVWFTLGNMHLVGILFQPFIYCVAIPFITLIVSIAKRRQILPLIPILLSIGLLFLSPVSTGNETIRYALVLIYASPLLIAYWFYKPSNNIGK